MLRGTVVSCIISMVLWIPAVEAQSEVSVKNVLDGVYSDAQAARGQAAYTAVCSVCHGEALDGVSAPALTGHRFIERWREDMLDTFHNFIMERMPPGRAAGANPLPADDYLDVLTYILKVNGYSAGPGELTTGLLGSIMFVGKNGPQPVPDGSLVVTVGCLSQARTGSWILFSATEPVRTRTSTTSTPAELRASSQKRLGALIFRLADMEAVPDFAPDPHKGHKMQAKGYLIRQPNAERISLSSIEMLDSTCGP